MWRAISDKTEFGTWFKVSFDPGPFQPGEKVRGRITHPGYEHVTMEIDLVEVVPEQRLSYRWHPYAIDPKTDFSSEPTTLVTFTLEDAPGGTRLCIVESGFDRLPPHRYDEAFRMNDRGWTGQIGNIERHVTASS